MTPRQPGISRAIVIACWVVAVGSPLPARADASTKQPTLVLESHTGKRPPGFGTVVEALDTELEVHGFAARPATILRLAGDRIPRPGVLDPAKTVVKIAQAVDDGYLAFLAGNFGKATKLLKDAIGDMHRNPALLAADARNGDAIFKAHAALALTYWKSGDATASLSATTELIRMFPTRPLSGSEYGPEAAKFYREVSQRVQAMGRGRLSISTGNRQAVISVDGQNRGIGKVDLGDLIPGVYSVLVQAPETVGRTYEVRVAANEDAFLNVRYDIDASLWADDTWVGFEFATDADRGNEAKYAADLAHRWGDDGTVVVVGSMQLKGRPAVIGTVYASDGKPMRSAVVAIEGAGSTAVRSLAAFLIDGKPGDDLVVLRSDTTKLAASVGVENREDGPRPWMAIGWGLGVGGIAGISLAAYMDHVGDTNARRGYPVAAVGIAVGVVTTIGYLLHRHSKPRSQVSVASTTSGAVASVGWCF